MKLIDSISPAPKDAWEGALRADPLALETQSPAWIEAMCAAGGFEDASRLYETEEGRILILPALGGGCWAAWRWKARTPLTAALAELSPRVVPPPMRSPPSSTSSRSAASCISPSIPTLCWQPRGRQAPRRVRSPSRGGPTCSTSTGGLPRYGRAASAAPHEPASAKPSARASRWNATRQAGWFPTSTG